MEEEKSNHALDMGPGDCNHRPPRKNQNKELLYQAIWASELNNLLNHHHKPDGEGIHVSVGDISKGRRLRWCLAKTKFQPPAPDGLRSSFKIARTWQPFRFRAP